MRLVLNKRVSGTQQLPYCDMALLNAFGFLKFGFYIYGYEYSKSKKRYLLYYGIAKLIFLSNLIYFFYRLINDEGKLNNHTQKRLFLLRISDIITALTSLIIYITFNVSKQIYSKKSSINWVPEFDVEDLAINWQFTGLCPFYLVKPCTQSIGSS